MKNYRSLVIVGLALLLVFLASLPAGATCTKFGFVIRVVTFEGVTYAMFRENYDDENYYMVEARDDQVSAALYQAYKGRSRVYIRTTDSACATTPEAGTNRINLGTVDRIGLGY